MRGVFPDNDIFIAVVLGLVVVAVVGWLIFERDLKRRR